MHFCAKGCNLDKPETMVSLNDVYDELDKRCKAELKLMFVDACRNDPADGKSGPDSRMQSDTMPQIHDPPGGIVAFFSCSTGQKSYESDKLKHGIFFHHVIQGLKGGPSDDPISKRGEVTVPLLEDYLTRAVPTAVKKDRDDRSLRQVPERVGKLRGQGLLALVAGSAMEIRPVPMEPRPIPIETGTSRIGDFVDLKGGEERSFEIANGVKMVFCWIPPGTANLGAQRGSEDEFEAEHEYTSKGFWMGKYAVMQKEYESVVGINPSSFFKEGKGHDRVKGLDTSRFPVEQVSWNDCQAFLKKCKLKGLKLPHEDEWEYACRGGKGNKLLYYWGRTLNGDKANCNGNLPYPESVATRGPNLGRTTVVGSYAKLAPHPWGLCDMSGNVTQWCDNCYDGGQTFRFMRGGSWSAGAQACRSASRDFIEPWFSSPGIGFRLSFRPD